MTDLWRHDYRSFLRSARKQPPAIIEEGILPVRTRMVIAGEENVGKTILAAQLAMDVSSGMPFLGLFDTPDARRVVSVQAEVPEALFQRRLAKSVKLYSRKIAPGFLTLTGPAIEIDTSTGADLLSTLIKETKAELLIIDPAYKFHTSDENDATSMKRFLKVLDNMIDRYGIAVVMTHHKKKPQFTSAGKAIRSGLAEVRGSSVITGWADSRLLMTNSDPKVTLDMELRHAVAKPPRVILTLDRSRALFSAEIPGGPTAAEATVIALVASGVSAYGELAKQAAGSLKCTQRHAKRVIAACRTKGLLTLGIPQVVLAGTQGSTWETEEDEIHPALLGEGEDEEI